MQPEDSALVSESAHRPRVLWVARYLPYPPDAGAKVYSAKLAGALTRAGCDVTFMGFGEPQAARDADDSIEWVAVPGTRRSPFVAIPNRLPIAAAVDATKHYVRLLERQCALEWDAIVFDGYGTGWALRRCLAYRRAHPGCVIVHVSHNVEADLWRRMARDASASFVKRFVLKLNAGKIARLEHALLAHADVVTAITEADRRRFSRERRDADLITLTPGFSGWIAPPRLITSVTPKRAVIVGSFRWVIKQDNLRRFLTAADAVFAKHGIALDIVGDVPAELKTAVEPRCHATRFHGFVADIAPLLADARIAIVPERIGGGFKLKFLDYVFARLPVATLAHACEGMPPAVTRHMIVREDMDSLVAAIVQYIDAFDALNAMQAGAFDAAHALFRWDDRGRSLLAAVQARRARQANISQPLAASAAALRASTP